MTRLEQHDIESFLKLGYFLNYENPVYSFDYSRVNKSFYKDISLEELIDLGEMYFINSIDKLFVENDKHVVPISGGLDSRAILAALLEFTETKNIYTYTFGTSGTLDYEIGNMIAAAVGTNHTSFSLTDYSYTMEELIDISNRISHQTILFHHAPVWELDKLYKGYTIWSGFLGGEITDSKYASYKSTISPKQTFINKERYQKKVNLTGKSNDLILLSQLTYKSNKYISDLEILDYENRQRKFIAPHVLMDGFKYNTPFSDNDLFTFFLSIDNRYRDNKFLYKKILQKRYPKLFSYPIKDNLGLPLSVNKLSVLTKKVIHKIKRKFNKKNPNENYFDFDLAIRQNNNFKELIRLNIADLSNRKIIEKIDMEEILKMHLNLEGDFGRALIQLVSLEIHMKAKENKQE